MARPGAKPKGKAAPPSAGFRAVGLLSRHLAVRVEEGGALALAANVGQLFLRLVAESAAVLASNVPQGDRAVQVLADRALSQLDTELQNLARAAAEDALAHHQEEHEMNPHEQVLDVMRTDPTAIWNASKVGALLNADTRTISGRMRRLAGEDRIERCETPGEYRLRTQAPATSPAAEPDDAACSSGEAAPEEQQAAPEVSPPEVEEEHAAPLPDPMPAAPEHVAPLPDPVPAAPEHAAPLLDLAPAAPENVAVPEAAPPAPAAPVRRPRSQKAAPVPVLVPVIAPAPVITAQGVAPEGVPPARPVTVTELEVEQLVATVRNHGRPISTSMLVSRLGRSGWRMANVTATLEVAKGRRLVKPDERGLYEATR